MNQPTPPPNKKSPKTLIILICVLAVMLTVILVPILIGGAFTLLGRGLESSFFGECKNGRETLFSQEQTITNEVNALSLADNSSTSDATISIQEGDCVDSLPTIFAKKTYTLESSGNAGDVFDHANKQLIDAGYTKNDSLIENKDPCFLTIPYIKERNNSNSIGLDLSLSCVGDNEDWRLNSVQAVNISYNQRWEYPSNDE